MPDSSDDPMMNTRQLRIDVERFGWPASIFMRLMRRLQMHLGIHVYRVRIRPLRSDHPSQNLPPEFSLAIVDRDALLRASEDPVLLMTREFVEAALAREDVVFGAFAGDRLVAYNWRTLTAAPHTDGLWVRVKKPYRYGYKGFTHPDYRGQRLNMAISFYSDAYFLARGYTNDIGLIDVYNMSSLATAKYKGNEAIGYAGYLKWFGRCLTYRTSRVKRTGFEFFDPG